MTRIIAIADVVGVAPMAGRGTRLGLDCSKEIAALDESRGQVLAEVMLARMAAAGLRRAVLTVAEHKEDVIAHFGERFQATGLHPLDLSYARANNSPNTPTSIDAGYQHIAGNVCALGFADILYQSCAGYSRALHHLQHSAADIVLGLFPTRQATSSDMVAFSPEGRVQEILIKQSRGATLQYTWSLAVWRPWFTEFLHHWVADKSAVADAQREVFVGDVVTAAQQAGLVVDACVVSALPSLDAGTPETLALARSTRWL